MEPTNYKWWGPNSKQTLRLFCQHSVIKGGSSTSRKQIQDEKESQIIMESIVANMPRMDFYSNKAFLMELSVCCGQKG